MGREPVIRSIDGCPIPEDGHPSDISNRLLDYWPVWDMQERLDKEGVTINRAVFRPGWVKLHIDWWRANDMWKTKVTALIIRDIVAMVANEQELYFNHWQVIRPADLTLAKNAWTDSLATAAKEAIVYFRTEVKHGKSVGELLEYVKKEEVNSIILANAFSLMEKEGADDQD
jgi:hypothetical protein